MSKKFLLAMSLVLVLGLVAFFSTSAQGEVSLTDAQMSSVYGGCVVASTGGGYQYCSGPTLSGDCSGLGNSPPDPGTCDRIRTTSCKQPGERCIGGKPDLGCVNLPWTNCEGTYDTFICFVNPSDTCVEQSYGPPAACYGRSPGTKPDAENTL
jgi:hypothetical protein